MKTIICKILILVAILSCIAIPVYARASVHSSHSTHITTHSTPHTSTHSTTHSSSSHSTTSSSKSKTITGAKSYSTPKTYTKPKTYTSKYNSSNIKRQTVNTNPSHFSSYSSTNIFRPNFWTAMWAFNCMKDNGNNNSKEVTEQDIAKELEERGYSQDEIKDILKDGEKAKEETNKEDRKQAIIAGIVIIVGVIIISGLVIWLACIM